MPRVELGLLALLASLWLGSFVSRPAWALALELDIAALRYAAIEIDAARLQLTGDGTARLRIGRLQIGSLAYRDLELHCAGFRLDRDGLACPRGEVRRAAVQQPSVKAGERPPLPFSFFWRSGSQQVEFSIRDADVQAFLPLAPHLHAYAPQGRADLHVVAGSDSLQAGLTVRALAFANQAGTVAGEGLAFDARIAAGRGNDGFWHWQAQASWPQGELYVAPWYRKAGIAVSAAGRLTGENLEVDLARIEVAGVGTVSAGLTFARDGRLLRWGLVSDALDLAAAMREWGQPWLDAAGGIKLAAAGEVRFAFEGDDEGVRHAYLGLDKAHLTEANGRFAFDGLRLTLPWARDATTEAELSVADGRLGAMPLGAFRLPIVVAGRSLRLEQLRVPLLDGFLRIDELQAEYGATGWQGHFSGGIEALAMPLVSQALGLPWMDGQMSARLPKVLWQGRDMRFEGGLDIEVFDGRIAVRQLRLVDLFLPTQRLLADVTVRHLDLGMLTGTFDFGAIEGRFDIDIVGLQLQGSRPLAFRAEVRNSAGNYRRTLSRSALRDISSLGGIAAAAAVQASPVRLFNSFDYGRIGFIARLEGEVLELDGLEPVDGGFLLIDGAGLPRVRVIGYNRRIDWPTLIARLSEVVAGKTRAVFE